MKRKKHKLNGEVRFPKVRLVGRGEAMVVSSRDAALIAMDEGKDLILINDATDPPIVRVEDYNKFLYELEKAEKFRKKQAHHSETKEIQLSAEIGDHDLYTKARKAAELLEDGSKIRCVLSLKGRQKANPVRGEITILKFVEMLSDNGSPESMPKLEGSRWIVFLKPRKK